MRTLDKQQMQVKSIPILGQDILRLTVCQSLFGFRFVTKDVYAPIFLEKVPTALFRYAPFSLACKPTTACSEVR